MVKIVYDIVPPQEVRHQEKIEAARRKKRKKDKASSWPWILGLIAVFVMGGFIYQIGFASFHLSIWPKTQMISLEKEILIQVNPDSTDQNVIPGQLVTDKRDLRKQFTATGQSTQGQKATGIIRVYNNYRLPKSIALRAQTRFLSSTEKYFKATKKINLPPAKWVKGKLIPSWVDVKVVALENGPDYNIKPDKFSIPGLVGTVYYSAIYGQSFEDMKNGSLKTDRKSVV